MSAQPLVTAPGSAPRQLEYPESTVPDLFTQAVARNSAGTCVDFLGGTRSYGQISAEVDRMAAGLLRIGVGAGDRIAVLLPTCPANLVLTLAALRIGAQVVQHNPLYSADELEPMFLDHGAEVVVAWDNALPTVMTLAQRVRLRQVIGVDLTRSLPWRSRVLLRLPLAKARAARQRLTAGRLPPEVLPYRTLARRGTLPAGHPGPAPDDVAVILYTSGTTGTPKGVPLTHRNLVANCRHGIAWTGLQFGEECFLSALPMFHAFGLTIGVLVGLALGAQLTMVPSPDPALMVQAMRRRPITFVVGVPPLLVALLDRAQADGVPVDSLRAALCGAMSLPTEFVERWEQATGGRLIEGYGLTETSPVAVGNPFDASRRPGTIGIPFPDTQARLVDPEHPSRDVGDGEEGELLVRGPQVFGGYLNKPVETGQAFVDGWFRTGDLARLEDGYLVLTGRLKELIITGGFNVSPVEVEQVLRRHPRISEVAVVGLPSSRHGEEVVAAVVADGELPDDEELRAWAKQHLAAYKVPRRFFTVEEFPTNLLGKVLRHELAARLAALT